MSQLTLALAENIVGASLKAARAVNLQPIAVVVYDERGALKAAATEDGASIKRAEIAMARPMRHSLSVPVRA